MSNQKQNEEMKMSEVKDPKEGYCVKCKAKKIMSETEEVVMKNGRPAMKGKCPDCGTGMYKILPSKKA